MPSWPVWGKARKFGPILPSQLICSPTLYFFLFARDFIPPNPGCRKAYFSTKVEFISSMAVFRAEYCSRPLKQLKINYSTCLKKIPTFPLTFHVLRNFFEFVYIWVGDFDDLWRRPTAISRTSDLMKRNSTSQLFNIARG